MFYLFFAFHDILTNQIIIVIDTSFDDSTSTVHSIYTDIFQLKLNVLLSIIF